MGRAVKNGLVQNAILRAVTSPAISRENPARSAALPLGRLPEGERVIEARGLTRRFGDVLAVDGIDLDMRPGTVVGLLGPNGTGKSTLLRLLIGLVRPNAGSATIAGARLVGDGTAVRKRVAFAPGEIALYGEMRASDQLTWLMRGRGRAAEAKAIAMTEILGLPLRKRIHEYSHGMKRQLLFCAAMGPDLPVRILDEPTEGLDPAKRSQVLELIAADAQKGRAILLSSHHLSEVETVCQRILFCYKGRLLADEDPATLRRLAARSGRLDFASETAATMAAQALQGVACLDESRAVERSVFVEFVEGQEPFGALASLEAGLPKGAERPIGIEFGRLSLTDLYERVYGVRGL